MSWTLAELETALAVATGEPAHALTFEEAEELRQRIIKLQLELERLEGHKAWAQFSDKGDEIGVVPRENH